MKRFLLVLAAVAPLAFAGQGHASQAGLPVVTSNTGCTNNQANPEVVQGVTSCTISGVQTDITLLPAVTLTSVVQGPDFGVVGGGANVQYYFEVVGGAAGAHVPIIILSNLSASFLGDAGASASITVNTDPNANPGLAIFNADEQVCANSNTGACTGEAAAFSGALNVTALSGVAAQVNLSILTGAAEDGTARAFADPMIEIDPNFADAGLYSLELSAGVGNALPATGGAPEPANWALMLAGFAMVGAALRRGRTAFHSA